MCENNKTSRFGEESLENIKKIVSGNTPANTVKTKASVWQQFSEFCKIRQYELLPNTTPEEIAKILEDYAYNMKKKDGENYKESSIKSIWNTTAKMVEEKFYNEFGIKLDPFSNIQFKAARNARDTKRKLLQASLDTRKVSSKALTLEEIHAMANSWSEENPEGLQKKFFHICAFELAWRGNEAANCKTHFFQDELNNKGEFTGRIEYNSIFSKTTQGGSKALASSKWLIKNIENDNLCPVRLLKKLMEKRGTRITSERLFLTVNPNWKNGSWYKNMPLGINTLSQWTKLSAEKIGLETKKLKITNHSHRSSTVSALAKKGIGEQHILKLTGHSNIQSIKPYLQLDSEHHKKLVQNLRETYVISSASTSKEPAENPPQKQVQPHHTSITSVEGNEGQNIYYNNCTFHIVNNYK